MTDEIEKDEESALTAEYVLGLLSDEESAAFEEVMVVEPSLREEYAFWADRIAALTDDLPEVAPPVSILAKLKEQLFDIRATTATDKAAATGRSWLQRLGLLPAVGAGLLAAVVALFVVNMNAPPESLNPLYTAELVAEDSDLVVLASYDETSQNLTLTREQGEARSGRSLELWLIVGEDPPVSMGVLPDDPHAVMAVDPALIPALEGGTLAITDEPLGGSSSGLPTGVVLAVGAVTRA